jgi:hypothetical protein
MFIGHFAVGFAAKRMVPRVSLGTLLMAAAFVDLLWPIFLITGLEHVRIAPGITAFTPLDFYDYPITHSIPGGLLWAAVVAGLWYARHRLGTAALVVAAVVLSHWVLDVVSHRADMPVLPNGPYIGLGLWYSVPATLMVEGALFVFGLAVYARSTRARDATGRWALTGMVVFLIAIYLLNAFGPPPPGERALAYGALAAWLLVPWPYWIDRHRVPTGSAVAR